ncbi:hypothetical protein H0H92_002302 [Tricholoma furcatifolium]|nr:hypothetical protein H0H92_002302 [Tricholoma furcatifolium]
MVGQVKARKAAGMILKIGQGGRIADRAMRLFAGPSTGKTVYHAEDIDEAMAESEDDKKMKMDFLAAMDGKIKKSDMTFFHAMNYDPTMFEKELRRR